MAIEHPSDPIVKAIHQKIEQLRSPIALKTWQFKLMAEGKDSVFANSEEWRFVPIPHSWSSADGEGWFRVEMDLPPVVEGIALAFSRIEFEFLLPIGAGIFLDGVEAYREPSWTDGRAVRLKLVDSYQPGIPLRLEIHCNRSDGLAQFQSATLVVNFLEEAIFQLDLVASQIKFCLFLSENNREIENKNQVLVSAVESLDLNALSTNAWDRWWESVAVFTKRMAPFEAEAKTFTTHLVAHSHIDMNWLWPYEETIDVCRRDFKAMLALMERYPEFHFSQSQTATYQFMERRYPDLFAQIKERTANGQWDVTASTWVEGDMNMASGESLARQFLHARRYALKNFGSAPHICWEPDTFGHPATLPQLLKKSGIDFYYFCRGGPDNSLFWWEGLDGSQVLAVKEHQWYMGKVTPSSVVESVVHFSSLCGTQRGLSVYGVGDHGGGGTTADIEKARSIDAAPFMPRALLDGTVPFFQKSAEEGVDLPVHKGELNPVFEGCYTSHGDIKQFNRLCENRLMSAESLIAIESIIDGVKGESLAEDWQTLCFHQFHDILCGCGISVTYQDARQKLEPVLLHTQEVIDRALDRINDGSQSVTKELPSKGNSTLVFNPLGWPRDSLVRIPLTQMNGRIPTAIEDGSGRQSPVQVSAGECLFIAEDLPAFGFQTYHLIFDRVYNTADSAVLVDTQSYGMENGIIRLQVNPENGEIDRLEDLEANRDLLPASPATGSEVTSGNLNRLEICWEKPHGMSAWVIGDIDHVETLPANSETRILDQGPVCGVIETHRTFLHSSITQRIRLYRRSRRIDVETEVDWHEQGNAHEGSPLLRVSFSPALQPSKATFEIPFAGLQRLSDGREVPALRWADLSEERGEYGFSLLNDGKYGHQADGNTLRLSLLRASYEPDLNPDEGIHKFTYSLYPHPIGWENAGTVQAAGELNQSVIAMQSNSINPSFLTGFSWIECRSDSVLISACKLAEDQPTGSKAMIVRLYENRGKPGTASIICRLPIAEANETDLIEQPNIPLTLDNNSLYLNFSPYEVKTIRIIFR